MEATYANAVKSDRVVRSAEVLIRRTDTPQGPIFNIDLEHWSAQWAAVLICGAGTWRSNHLHKTDEHYLYVLSGVMDYWEGESEDNPKGEHVATLTGGECIYTPAGVPHATYFPEQTILLSLSKFKRTPEAHEADLVRVQVGP